MYEGLTVLDAEMRVRPALALSWESPNDRTWRFHLRPGVRFHDGRSLTAADVVFSLDRAQHHPRTKLANYLVAVRTVRALDPVTVEIVTDPPSAILLNKLASLYVVPDRSPEEITRPVGTGPYRFAGYPSKRGLRMEAFPAYWNGPAQIANVEFVIVADPAERVNRLLGHSADFVQELPAGWARSVSSQPGLRVASHEGLGVFYLQGPMDRRPFSDRRVRAAINLALDRAALVAADPEGGGSPAGQPVGSGVFGYEPRLLPPQRDPARARRLLAEAGFPRGLDMDLEFRTGRNVEELARQLAEAGVRVRPRPRPWAELYPRLQSGDVGFYFGAVVAFSGDASDVLDGKAHTRDLARGYGETNSNHYSNPALDRLIEDSSRTLDMHQRRELEQRALAMFVNDLAIIPLCTSQDHYALRDDLQWSPRLDGRVLAYEIRYLR